MARPKKAKGDQPAGEQESAGAETSGQEDSGETKAHVSADALAGSPDIFAPKPAKRAAAADAKVSEAHPASSTTEPEVVPEVVPEPVAEEAAASSEASAESEPSPVAAMVEAPAAGPPPPPPTYVTAQPAHPHRTSSTMALGIVLVVLGLFFLTVRLFDVDLSRYGWPLYIIIPGLTLLAVGYVSLGSGALIPGGIVTTAGLVLAYQSATEDWASWAYAWALVAPGGVGLGLFLEGLRTRDAGLIKQGRTLIFVAALIFMIGFVIFETIFNISNFDYGLFGKAALPGLLIVIGVILLARSMQRRRA